MSDTKERFIKLYDKEGNEVVGLILSEIGCERYQQGKRDLDWEDIEAKIDLRAIKLAEF